MILGTKVLVTAVVRAVGNCAQRDSISEFPLSGWANMPRFDMRRENPSYPNYPQDPQTREIASRVTGSHSTKRHKSASSILAPYLVAARLSHRLKAPNFISITFRSNISHLLQNSPRGRLQAVLRIILRAKSHSFHVEVTMLAFTSTV